MAVVEPIFRPPKQKRSRETVERILTAAETCICERGFDALRIAEVAHDAGSAVGTVYSRFADKMALLRAVQKRLHDRIEPPFLADLALEKERGGSLEEAVERVFTSLCRHFLSERELFSACMMQAVFDPFLKEQGEEASRVRREAVSAALLVHRDQMNQPDPTLAVDVAYDTCIAVVKARLIWGEPSHFAGEFSDEVLIHELTRMVATYLLGHTGIRPYAGPRQA